MKAFDYIDDLSVSEETATAVMELHVFHYIDIHLVDGLNFIEDLLARGWNNFEEYFDAKLQNLKEGVCRSAWCSTNLYARCRQCAKSEDACVCLSCLLKGDHEGHEIKLVRGGDDNCCCGNPDYWEPSGYCSKHAGCGQDPAEEIDRATRVVLTGGMAAVLRNLEFYALYQKNLFLLSVRWTQRILFLGDAVKRCIVKGVIKRVNFASLFDSITKVDSVECHALFSFLGSLLNDELFRNFFARSVVANWAKIVRNHMKIANLRTASPTEPPLSCSQHTISFSKHAFTMQLAPMIVRDVPWVDVLMETFALFDLFVLASPRVRVLSRGSLLQVLERVNMLVKMGIKAGTPESVDSFFEQFTDWLAQYEMKFLSKREMGDKIDDIEGKTTVIFHMMMSLADIGQQFGSMKIGSGLLKKLYPFLVPRQSELSRCVLDPSCEFCMTFVLSRITYFCTHADDKFMESCKQLCEDTDLLFMTWALMPLRFLFVAELSQYGFFVRNPSQMLDAFGVLRQPAQLKHYLQTFVMVQGLWLKCQDKCRFLKMIASVSGIFHREEDMSPRNKHDILFCFLYFVSCLVYDRMAMNNDDIQMKRLNTISLLKLKPQKAKDLELYWGSDMQNAMLENLASFAEKHETDSGLTFKLVDDSDWHPLLIFIRTNMLLEIMYLFTSKNSGSIMKFPDLPPDLSEVLKDPIMFAVYYHVLSDTNVNHQLVQFVLNLLIDAYTHFPDEREAPGEIFITNELSDLIEAFKGCSVRQFIHTEVGYCGRPIASVFNLLHGMGDLGFSALLRLGLVKVSTPRAPTPDAEDKMKMKREMKERVIKSFLAKQREFSSGEIEAMELEEDDVKVNPECEICHDSDSDKVLLYPIFVYKTVLPDLIARQVHFANPMECGPLTVTYGIRHCLHPLHRLCHMEEVRHKCPVDGTKINGYLPRVSTGFEPVSNQEMLAAITEFLGLFGKTSDDEHPTVTLLGSFVGQIDVLETRQRANPHVFDEQHTLALLHNFFLCIWESRTRVLMIPSEETAKLPPMMRLVLETLEAEKQELPLRSAAKNYAQELTGVDQYIFLRRVALFEHFGLNMPLSDERDRDWAKLLSYQNLCSLYGVDADEQAPELPRFRVAALPSDILGFMKPPYEIDISRIEAELGVCLLTGTVLALHSGENLPTIAEVLRSQLGGTATLVAIATGPRASCTFVTDLEHDRILETKSCYVDRYGAEDKGLYSGDILKLSQARLDWVTDFFLSGDWTRLLSASS